MIAAMWAVALIILGLLAVSAVFSAAETALTRASRGRMHQLEREGDPAARRVNRLLSDQETMIGAVLIGYNVLNILSSVLATMVITKAIPGAYGVALATGVMTVLVVVFVAVWRPRPSPSSAPTMWPAPSRGRCCWWCGFWDP